MIVRIAKSIKQPVLYSCFVSKFSSLSLEVLKDSKPFATYHKETQEYEVTPDVLDKITEQKTYVNTAPVPEVYTRRHFERYGYQQDAVEFARKSRNVFLNFSQGMGKSLTTFKIVLDRAFERTLIVCGQANLQEEWLKDAHKHGVDASLDIKIVGEDSGAPIAKRVKWLSARSASGVVDLINIEALRSEGIVLLLNDRKYDCIVVDEVQSAKGWKSQQTEGLHSLIRHEGQYRIALSGTPVLNDPLEFFSLLKFFGVLDQTARTTFEKYYGEFGFDFWGHYVCKGFKNLEQLAQLVRSVACYADKSELNLPLKVRKLVRLPFSSQEEYAKLSRIYKLPTAKLKKAGFDTKPQVRAIMQNISSMDKSKFDFVVERARENKVLVFSQYTTVLDDYYTKLQGLGVKVLYYHGKLSMKERLDVLEKWRTGAYDVLLLSIMAARYGINLTEAWETIFLDIPTGLAVLEQAEDRSHRIGQEHQVTSYLLQVSSIDQDMLDAIEAKQRDIDDLNDRIRS